MRQILISVAPNGSVDYEVAGFKGKGCEKATQFLDALGRVTARKKKPEYSQTEAHQQRVGR